MFSTDPCAEKSLRGRLRVSNETNQYVSGELHRIVEVLVKVVAER